MTSGRAWWRSAFLALSLLGLIFAMAHGCVPGGGSEFGDEDDASSKSSSQGGSGGVDFTGVGGSGAANFVGDPKTCEEAAASASYVGCDFWPTVTPNNVWSIFDYAVVVANTGENVVDVTVTRGANNVGSAQIQPDSVGTIYLPWVPELKGPDADSSGGAMPLSASVRVANGAYHLTSTYPVTVYQFNALEYAPVGGPPGKNWNNCPADGIFIQCFSYSNDASLLLPSTAMTGNYRITSIVGWPTAGIGAYLTITGITDNTNVTLALSQTGGIVAGGGLTTTGAGGTSTFTISRGEVIVVLAPPSGDLSGSLLTASNPVQVLTGIPCQQVPDGIQACDHLEETVFPAETLGARYVVTRPTGPNGDTPGHVVRIYGNFDGTNLTYTGDTPPGAPTTLNAGQVVDLGRVNGDFEVSGDQAFAIASLELGAAIVDPNATLEAKGDPAMSLITAVEQYRDKYVFLAPTDYDVSYVDVIHPAGASITLDGGPLSGAQSPAGNAHTVTRALLGSTAGGAHILESDVPVGIQVTGYGAYTSFYYPGGLNLKSIAPPPVQ